MLVVVDRLLRYNFKVSFTEEEIGNVLVGRLLLEFFRFWNWVEKCFFKIVLNK